MSGARALGAIVGCAETDGLGRLPEYSALRLNTESAVNALDDAGLELADVDGIAGTGRFPVDVAHDLGIVPKWVDNTSVGGCSYLLHVRHAVAAIQAGMATTVLITHGESGRSRNGQAPFHTDSFVPRGQWEVPYGVGPFYTMFTVPVLRFLKETGITQEQLAEVAVAQRRWAHLNPRAYRRDLITVDDVFSSPMIAYPFHQLQCCLVTDGGGSLVVTSAERARDLPQPPVYVIGTGESAEHPAVSQMTDFTSSRAFRTSSSAAFEQSGLTPSDIDHLMVYDAFAHLPLYGLQDLGFVARGEAGAFIAEGHTSPGGLLPMNTNGGGLSYTHTGMYGMFAIQEAVRQLRGQAAAQVDGLRTSFVQGVGGMFMAAASLVLTNEQ
jgi:acetyl-CoA acetyltransferase